MTLTQMKKAQAFFLDTQTVPSKVAQSIFNGLDKDMASIERKRK